MPRRSQTNSAHAIRQDIGQAAEWVAQAIEERDPHIAFLLCHPISQDLRRSVHWPALRGMMSLPEAG